MKNNIVYKIYRQETIKKIEDKISLLGVYNKMDVAAFLNIRLVGTILLFIIVFIGFDYGYVLAPIFSCLFYVFVPMIMIEYPIKKRGKKLEKEALFFLEVLALTLESGRNLKHAITLTVENIDSEVSEEFRRMLAEVKLGKSLEESLQGMKKRIPSEAINNTILNMIQSNTFGSNILDSLYNQIDFLREKQMLDIKAEIQKLPTKVSVISVIFFIPIMMLIILMPVLIEYIMK